MKQITKLNNNMDSSQGLKRRSLNARKHLRATANASAGPSNEVKQLSSKPGVNNRSNKTQPIVSTSSLSPTRAPSSGALSNQSVQRNSHSLSTAGQRPTSLPVSGIEHYRQPTVSISNSCDGVDQLVIAAMLKERSLIGDSNLELNGRGLYVSAPIDPPTAIPLPSNKSELELYLLLVEANLLTYFASFIRYGGDDMRQLSEASEEEFMEIMELVGMNKKPLHVRRLQKALAKWRETRGHLFNSIFHCCCHSCEADRTSCDGNERDLRCNKNRDRDEYSDESVVNFDRDDDEYIEGYESLNTGGNASTGTIDGGLNNHEGRRNIDLSQTLSSTPVSTPQRPARSEAHRLQLAHPPVFHIQRPTLMPSRLYNYSWPPPSTVVSTSSFNESLSTIASRAQATQNSQSVQDSLNNDECDVLIQSDFMSINNSTENEEDIQIEDDDEDGVVGQVESGSTASRAVSPTVSNCEEQSLVVVD